MKVILEKWDAIELFCRVLSKHQNLSLVEFKDNSLIVGRLNNFSKTAFMDPLVIEMIQDCGKPNFDLKTGWYNFVHDIHYSVPLAIPQDIYSYLCKYVVSKKKDTSSENHNDVSEANTKQFVQKDSNQNKNRTEQSEVKYKLSQFIPTSFKTSKEIIANDLNNKQRFLEETSYWLYFFDEFNSVEDSQVKTFRGISKALLELKLFGKSKLTRLRNNKTHRIYQGTFELIKNSEYLFFKMRVKEERHLRMLFFIGSDDTFTLSVGMSAHISTYDNARAMMIEPIKGRVSSKSIGFYQNGLENNNVIVPQYAIDYFLKTKDDKHPKIMRAPKGITSVETLYRWMSDNNIIEQ